MSQLPSFTHAHDFDFFAVDWVRIAQRGFEVGALASGNGHWHDYVSGLAVL
jgi:hypothetical protein